MTPQSGQTLEGRVAIVTGAGTIGPGVGVGKATSVVLAQQGAKLVLTDIDARTGTRDRGPGQSRRGRAARVRG